ncbi:MAG: PQQ-binding-like beta-propeller repeat protein [Actinobacteria bacterium]|nr:PQQ-binding-like beta-propeller repeat protein [Actinomycetota bacterium]
MSSPVIAGDTILAYVQTSGVSESLIAWDRTTGEELWRAVVLPGRDAPGVAQRVAVITHDGAWRVAYLAPIDADDPPRSWMRLAVADVRSGEEIEPQLKDDPVWSRRPATCKQESAFCLEGRHKEGSKSDGELILRAGRLLADEDPRSGFNEDGFLVGRHVSYSYGDATTVRYGVDGAYTWWRSYEEVFGDGTSPTGGWAWHDDDDGLPVIGWGGAAAPEIASYPADDRIDLTAGRTVGLDRRTGETLWTQEHTDQCAFRDAVLRPNADGILPLCRYRTGTVVRHFEKPGEIPDLTYDDVDIDLIGVDASSGDVAWTVPLGDEPRNYSYHEQPTAPWSDSEQHAVGIVNGERTVIDLGDGTTRRLAPDVDALCAPERSQIELASIFADIPYATAKNLVVCDVTGRVKHHAKTSPAALALAGFDLHDDIAMVLDGELAYFPRIAESTPARTSTSMASSTAKPPR